MMVIPLAIRAPDPQVVTRPVRLSDTEALYTSCWPERDFTAIYNLVLRATRSQTDKRGLGLVIVDERDRACGYGQLTLWPMVGEISDLVVEAAHRSEGWGTAMVQTLVRKAVNMGLEEVEIGASSLNPRAGALYRRLGFVDSHTLMVNTGQGREEVQYMRLKLRQK